MITKLKTISMPELYDTFYPPKKAVVENLFYEGLYLFVGAPKIGKSFFMAQLAYHVSEGLELFGNAVNKGGVLYLALEDTPERLQSRLVRMFDTNVSPNLHFSTEAETLAKGLEAQLTEFIKEHQNTKLIILDTLQKARCLSSDYSYSSDYDVISRLKKFSDRQKICLVVHHTRKMDAADAFETISGTNGLLGAADGAFILQKEKRTESKATLDVVGRDQPDQKLHLDFDRSRCLWKFIRADCELWKAPPDPLLEKVAAFISDVKSWKGKASELLQILGIDNMEASVLSRKLNASSSRLLSEYKIAFDRDRSGVKRWISLSMLDETNEKVGT